MSSVTGAGRFEDGVSGSSECFCSFLDGGIPVCVEVCPLSVRVAEEGRQPPAVERLGVKGAPGAARRGSDSCRLVLGRNRRLHVLGGTASFAFEEAFDVDLLILEYLTVPYP